MAATKTQKYIAGGIMYILLFAGAQEGIGGKDADKKCGGEDRWQQKILVDDKAMNINTLSTLTTIASINSINTTAEPNKFADNKPRMSIEQQVYTIKHCYISDAVRENDNDVHLVIEDGKGHHMIAEIPDPSCIGIATSPWLGDIQKVRNFFLDHASNYRHFLFSVTGPLFVDKAHSQTGRAANNIEIHPVLKLDAEKQINPILIR